MAWKVGPAAKWRDRGYSVSSGASLYWPQVRSRRDASIERFDLRYIGAAALFSAL